MADLIFGAVIPAAGESSRMGALKPLVEIGGQTLVERAANLFQAAGVEKVVAVAGHQSEQIIPALEGTIARPVTNPDYQEGMLTSIQVGAGELQGRCDAFFVLPVDIPLVRSLTIRRLVEQFTDRSALVCHPVFDSRHGHPPLIDSCLIEELLAFSGKGGLKAFLEGYAKRSVDVPVADAWIRRDVDTDEELAALRRDFESYTIPTRQECEVMLEHYLVVPEAIRSHGRKVAHVAVRLGQALNAAGEDLDLGLTEAAGRLHDAFKRQKDHAGQAASWLREAGFPEVADVVGGHMELPWEEGDTIDEKALIYLADKAVEGEQVVTIEERRAALLKRYGHDEEARRAIAARLKTAEKIRTAVEQMTGLTFTNILSG